MISEGAAPTWMNGRDFPPRASLSPLVSICKIQRMYTVASRVTVAKYCPGTSLNDWQIVITLIIEFLKLTRHSFYHRISILRESFLTNPLSALQTDSFLTLNCLCNCILAVNMPSMICFSPQLREVFD